MCLYLKFRLANCEACNKFTNLRENRLNKMAKEMNLKQHRFQGFLPKEISRSSIYMNLLPQQRKKGNVE